MERGLMLECKNHGSINCHPEIRRYTFTQELKNGEGPELMPMGAEQERLDDICDECRFFKYNKVSQRD